MAINVGSAFFSQCPAPAQSSAFSARPISMLRCWLIAGGPQREAPATHIEWVVRESALEAVLSWRFG